MIMPLLGIERGTIQFVYVGLYGNVAVLTQ